MYQSYSGLKRCNISQAKRNYKAGIIVAGQKSGIRKSLSGKMNGDWRSIASHTKMWFGTRNLWIGCYGGVIIKEWTSKTYLKRFSNSGLSNFEKKTIIKTIL
jgi:hypothetical protein